LAAVVMRMTDFKAPDVDRPDVLAPQPISEAATASAVAERRIVGMRTIPGKLATLRP
jgi:hypothetical protein